MQKDGVIQHTSNKISFLHANHVRNIIDKELNATKTRCASCCDFDMNNNSVHNRSPLPANYPINQHVDSPPPPLGR